MEVLRIRAYQLRRNLGMLLWLLVPLASALSYFFFSNYQGLGHYTAACIVYLFYSFHRNRQDKVFARRHFKRAAFQMGIEYQLFLLPLSVPCLFTSYWYCFVPLHVLVLAIPFGEFNFRFEPKLLFLGRPFKGDYVFIAGFRRHFLSLGVLVLLALLLSPLKLFPLLALSLINILIFSFYEYNESVQMLQASNLRPARFLKQQNLSAMPKLLLINGPVVLINTIFNPELLLFNAYFLVYSMLMIAVVITAKYAAYRYQQEKNNLQAKMALMMFGLLNPYLSLMTLVFYILSRKEALKNLAHYLDDTH